MSLSALSFFWTVAFCVLPRHFGCGGGWAITATFAGVIAGFQFALPSRHGGEVFKFNHINSAAGKNKKKKKKSVRRRKKERHVGWASHCCVVTPEPNRASKPGQGECE